MREWGHSGCLKVVAGAAAVSRYHDDKPIYGVRMPNNPVVQRSSSLQGEVGGGMGCVCGEQTGVGSRSRQVLHDGDKIKMYSPESTSPCISTARNWPAAVTTTRTIVAATVPGLYVVPSEGTRYCFVL